FGRMSTTAEAIFSPCNASAGSTGTWRHLSVENFKPPCSVATQAHRRGHRPLMNATPLANVLDVVVQPYVSPALIAPDNFAAMQGIARLLPSTLTTFFGFECRLGATAAPTDFLLCVHPPGERDVLAGHGAELPAHLLHHPVWQRLCAFARHWADPDAVL